jgi:hypothetical protein
MNATQHRTSRLDSADANRAPLVTHGVPAEDAPALAAIVASAVPKTRLALRARVLRRLLMPVGPLAVTVLAGGAFAKYLQFARWSRLSVTLEDAAHVTSSQIVELVRYVEQSNPTVLEQVMVVLSRDATTMAALGASVAAIAMQLRSRRKFAGGQPPQG